MRGKRVEKWKNLGYGTKSKSTLRYGQAIPSGPLCAPYFSHIVYLLSRVLGNECDTLLDILAIDV
jgi:hypothetical protein